MTFDEVVSSLTQLYGMLDGISRAIQQSQNRLWPNAVPSVADLVHAWRCGTIADGVALQAIQANAAQPPDQLFTRMFDNDGAPGDRAGRDAFRRGDGWQNAWAGVWDSRVTVPAPGDLLALLNQRIIPEARFHNYMKFNGWYDESAREDLIKLSRNVLPSPASLVSMAVREAWDPVTVQRFGYDEEFPSEFAYWMARQGADGDSSVGGAGGGGQGAATWSKMYWRTHWQIPSYHQAAEMFQRLRPNRMARFGADLAGLRPFTFDDLKQVLKIVDYPTPFRPQLAAIAYKLPRLVDIDRFYQLGVVDEAEVYEMHRDRGYNPADARLRTAYLVQRKLQNPQNRVVRQLPNRIVELYRLGRLLRGAAADRLIAAVSGGRFTSVMSYNGPPEGVDTWIDAKNLVESYLVDADVKSEVDATKKLVSAYRRQFLHGQIAEAPLRAEMQSAGFAAPWVQQWIAGMKAELASGRLLLSTDRVKTMAAKGIMPFATATTYLTNLGWKEPEIGFILAQVRRDIAIEQERQTERETKEQEVAEAAQLRQASALRRARDQVIRRLNRQASPQALKRYFVRGIVSELEYIRELERRGFENDAIKNIIKDANIDRAKYLEKQRARFDEPPVGTNGFQGGGSWES